MKAYIGRKQYVIKAMDIESHNDEESIAKNETSAWLGCYLDEDSRMEDERSYFYSIREFLSRIEDDSRPKRGKKKEHLTKNICCFCYNLSFEWSFILPVLLEMGFTYGEPSDDAEMVYTSISTKSCSSVWCASLKFGKKNGVVILRDLAKMFPGGLGNVAEAFGLPTQKGEIDYRKNRLHGYQVTQEEKEYCFKDTRIVMEILMIMHEKNDKDFWQSSSMASYSMRKLLKEGFPRSKKPYLAYRKLYPELSEEENNFLRTGVEGGITYPPARWQFKEITQKIGHIDKHQMHPSSAYFNAFPYGFGEYFTGKPPLGKICACHIRISYDDVKLHSIIKLIGLDFITGKEITVWDFEIPTMFKCYVNLKVEYIDGYAYHIRRLPWRKYYADNYRKRLVAKMEKNKFYILYFKLLNNSSYGKHLEKPHNKVFVNTIRADGIIDSNIFDAEEYKANARYTYLPVGSCIPAYSRVDLIETALKFGWENIVYFDTDSIFFLWNEQTEKVWKSLNQEDFLGGWGWEEMIDRAQFAAPKRYKTETDGKAVVKAAGINFKQYRADHGLDDDTTIPFDEVNIVSSTWKVQRAYRVKGGTIIKFQEKEMDVQPKYQAIYERNAAEI